MMATIEVAGLKVSCIIGIHPHERETEQTVLVDLEVDHDVAAAAAGDDFRHAVDYVALADLVRDLLHVKRYRLLETFVVDATTLVLERHAVARVRVRARKPAAIPEADWTAVTCERGC